MARPGSETTVVLAIVAALAVVVALYAGSMLAMSRSMMGGGNMGGGGGPGALDLGVLGVAIAVAGVAIALALRPRAPRVVYVTQPAAAPAPEASPGSPAGGPTEESARIERLQEAAVVRALDEDERRMYLQIREAGGTALQRDLVASRAFSKPKVTRLLDKLERKGLVVRERAGSTNRVRLTWKGPPPA